MSQVLRISRLGHRNRILAAIGSLPFTPTVPGSGSTCQMNDDDQAASSSHSTVFVSYVSFYPYFTCIHIKASTHLENLEKSGNFSLVGKNQGRKSQRNGGLPVMCYCSCGSHKINIT